MKSLLLFLTSFCCLVSGGLLYILFRSKSLIMFSWANSLGLDTQISLARETTSTYKQLIPEWVIYSLPDGLWSYAYSGIMLWVWKIEISIKNILWIVAVPAIACLSELGQYVHIIPGTFDGADLALYLIGSIIPILIFNKKHYTNENKI